MCRHDDHLVSHAAALRLLRDEGLLLEANYQWCGNDCRSRPDGEAGRLRDPVGW